MDLDDEVVPLPIPAAGDALLVSEDDLRKAAIVRLGLAYHLVSKHTSFVAVQKGGERGRRRGSAEWARSKLAQTGLDVQEDRSAERPTFLDHLINGISSFFTSVFVSLTNPAALASTANTPARFHSRRQVEFPGAYSESDSDTSQSGGRRLRRRSDSQRRHSYSSNRSAATFSSLSSLEGSSCSSCWTFSRSPTPQFKDPIERASSPEVAITLSSGVTDTGCGPSGSQGGPNKRHPIPPEVYALFQQMAVDGSFTATPLLSRLVGDAVLGKADELRIDKKVWTTVVFVAYIKTRLQSEPDLLDLMSEKAKEFVEASEWSRRDGAKRFEEMVRDAVTALTP